MFYNILLNTYDNQELKAEQSSAHIPCKSMASPLCEYGCDTSNVDLSWQSKGSVDTGVTGHKQFLHQLQNVFYAYGHKDFKTHRAKTSL